MVRCVNLVVRLPDRAAEQLTDLARRQHTTVDGFVAGIIEDWLEQRRKEARLGRKDQAQSNLRATAAEGTRVD